MNDHAIEASTTRSRVRRSVGSLIIVAAGLLAGEVRADEPAKVPAPGPILNLTDGGFATGTLAGSDRPGMIRWQAASFAAPFEFALDAVQSVRFPLAERSPKPIGAFGFELSGGDVVYGSLLGLDDKAAELDVTRLGRLKLERSRIRRIFRWGDGVDLIYNGPNGLTGWREVPLGKATLEKQNQPAAAKAGMAFDVRIGGIAAPKPAPKAAAPAGPAWIEDGGQLVAVRDGISIVGDLGLPARASLEFELSWKQSPDFVLALGVTDDDKSYARAFRFEAWQGQIVVLRELEKEADVVSLQPIAAGPGRAQFQVFLDQELGKILVFSAGGELLAGMNLGESKPELAQVHPGLRLTNLKGDLRLERLRIGRWDGETPRPTGADASRIQKVDGSIVRGQIDRFDAASREFVVRGEAGESRVAEDRVGNVLLSRSEDDVARGVRVVYQDGTRIGGEWVKAEAGSVFLTTPGLAEPLRLPLEGVRSIEVIRHDGKPAAKDAMVGTLEMDGLRLAGRLVNSGEKPVDGGLVWQPLASESGSPLRSGASGRIVYRAPAPRTATTPTARAPVRRNVVGGAIEAFQQSLDRGTTSTSAAGRRSLYLRTGDIVPIEVTKIDEEGVTFKTEYSESTFVPHARIKAVELAQESGTAIKLNKVKFERLLTLPRMQKGSPPTQMIRSKTGDMLRGRVIGMDDKTIKVEVRLEEKEIPRDRVSRIIWLHADETDPSKKPAEPPVADGTTRVQAVKSDGIRMTFVAERCEDGTLSGKSDVLGTCKVRLQDLEQLLIGGSVEKEATQLAYQNWKLQNAPEPKSAQDDASSGGGAGTESALVGKQAPDFTLDLMDGKKFHLAENKGKVVVLDFWATWCGPCLQAMPQIDKVTHEFADKGVQLIAVNLQETPAQIKSMLERQKLSPTVVLDKDGVVAEKYGANAIPQTVVIDREGKITRLFIGGGPHLGDQLRDALKTLMPDEKPNPAP